MDAIRTDGSNAFAHHTVTVRLPGMLDQVLSDNPGLSAGAIAGIRRLRQEILTDHRLQALDPQAPDYDAWSELLADHERRLGHAATWRNAEWFVIEHYFFRRIIDALDYWTAPRDPFGPAKARQLDSPELALSVEAVVSQVSRAESTDRDDFASRLGFALWGNRIDLSHAGSVAHGAGIGNDDALIVDHSELAWGAAQTLTKAVHFVTDNAGTELAADLCLSDWFITARAVPVHLHVKYHPTFVSDATAGDVDALLDRFGTGPYSEARQSLVSRLTSARADGSLVVTPDLFWNSPRFFDDLPDHILAPLSRAGLIIIKGDMNYRRLLRDRVVPATDPLSQWATPLPAPAVLLRTMKGDPVAGLDHSQLTHLDRAHPGWRTAGRHGLVQMIRS